MHVFEILPRIGNNMLPLVITLRPSFVRPQLLRIFSSKTTWPLKINLWWNGSWVIPFQNCVRQSQPPTNMALLLKIKKTGGKLKKSSETTGSIETTICLKSPWMILFQNCVRQSRLSTNMATVAKIEKRGMQF
jgi:hypothetical protein